MSLVRDVRLRVSGLALLCGLCLIAGAPALAETPGFGAQVLPPLDPPRVLLSAPLNALWAANHPEQWRSLGVDGLLLQGIMPTIADDIWRADGDPTTFGEDDRLLQEVRAGNNRLKEAGLLWNFISCSLEPAAPWFADTPLVRDAVDRFGELGAFCQLAAVHGIALDTRSSSVVYDYRWDGYPLRAEDAARVRLGAREFGRGLLRAFLRACPAAEILIIADDPMAAGTIWIAFFEGMLDAFGAAQDIRLHLLVRNTIPVDDPLEMLALRERLDRYFAARLEAPNLQRWRNQCTWAAGLAPLTRDATYHPVARLSPESFHVQRAAAKLHSAAYVWVESETQDYWRVPSREAASYLNLLQLGHMPAGQNAPLIDNIDAFAFRDPIDTYCRVGFLDEEQSFYVVQDQHGASLVAWDAMGRPLELPESPEAVEVMDLASGVTATGNRDQLQEQGASAASVVVGPLPAVPTVLQASLWMQSELPLVSGMSRTRLHFGFRNPMDTLLTGRLEAAAPQDYAIGAASFPLSLDPNESAAYSRMLQGRFEPGDAGAFSLALALPGLQTPGGALIPKSFTGWIGPETYWTAWRDGPIAGAPQIVQDNESAIVLLGGIRGELAAYDLYAGEMIWEQRWRVAFPGPPAIGQRSDGRFRAGIVDARGHLRVVDEAGEKVLVHSLEGNPRPATLAVLSDPTTDELVWLYGTEDSQLVALDMTGGVLWKMQLPGPARKIGVVERLIHVLTDAAAPAVLQFDAKGGQLWRCDLNAAAVGQAQVIPGPPASVVVLQENGEIAQIDAVTGRILRNVSAAGKLPMALSPGKQPGPHWLLTSADGVAALDDQFALIWQIDMQCSTAAASVMQGAVPQIITGTAGGGVVALGTRRQILWRDTHTAGPITSIQPVAEDSLLLVTSPDGSIRCLVVPTMGPDTEAAR